MRKLTKRTAIAAAALAAVVALTATVGVTGAYFTTYAAAKGSVEISLNEKTTIDESFGSWSTHVTVSN